MFEMQFRAETRTSRSGKLPAGLAVRLSVVAAVWAWCAAPPGSCFADSCHVWEKVEIPLRAEKSYENPYTEVQVWVDLEGPDFRKRCYGFWDGGSTFRVRVLATAPGTWHYTSGSNQDDKGLNGVRVTFEAATWTEAEKQENPCRRGMIRPAPGGHAFQYADGTPFFLLGDTWWATPTFRYPWHDDPKPRPLGPNAGFKDYVRYRKRQEFNCVAMIAAFPHWANDGRPNRLKLEDGTPLRAAWSQPGTKSAKDMHDEEGNRAFFFPGKIPGYEDVFPDLDRINPAYFRNLDRKIDYLNRMGIVPFIEVARRDIGHAWKKYHRWPDSYSRYIQYVWSRYQGNLCLFSPIHFDTPGWSVPARTWSEAANRVIDRYGPPPFGTLAGTNSNPSSLVNFGHVDEARWLGFHQIGNRRTHDNYAYLTEIFRTRPPVPAINGEPYYDGMPDADPGTEKAALYCRSGMYGSVLSGGLGGHIYGAGGWDGGMWGGNVEKAAEHHVWDVLPWPSADQMRHLKTFVLSEGPKYQQLVPNRELLDPRESGPAHGYVGWAYAAGTPGKDFLLLYFEKDCPRATLSGLSPDRAYQARWFNPRSGQWTRAGEGSLVAGPSGTAELPPFPNGKPRSSLDWALKLTLVPK
jgi:hypothetical protein